ncbi:MAG: RidA family protein [Acidimicrobiales bacterium]
MSKQVVNPGTVHAPTGYSHAVVKAGAPVFIAGQVALSPEGRLVGRDDPAAQAVQAFENVKAVVEGCGGAMSDVVKLTVYTVAREHRGVINEARARHFEDGEFPASTFVVISSLAMPEFLVEIEAVAMLDAPGA